MQRQQVPLHPNLLEWQSLAHECFGILDANGKQRGMLHKKHLAQQQ
jgi:hypothetical protein